jgi:peptidoglycan/xylan/chitin deacetylase (PgdA/CDA1 family)
MFGYVRYLVMCVSLLKSKSIVPLLHCLIGGAVVAGGLSGCGQANTGRTVMQPAMAVAPAVSPTPTPTPKPKATPRATPTPNAQTIPAWARGHVINSVKVKPGQKVFALTFDDGPWPQYTRQVLQILKRYNAKATFFMVGQELQRRPEIAREVKAAGHAIGNHSWDHPMRPRDAVAQIKRTDAVLRSIGVDATLFRPPYGNMRNGLAKAARNEKQAVLLWSADSDDWKRGSARSVARRIINQAHAGGIGLLHDGGGSRAHSIAALPVILKTLQARGYRFVTVPELLKMRYVAPKPMAKPAKPKKQKKQAQKSQAKHAALPKPVAAGR